MLIIGLCRALYLVADASTSISLLLAVLRLSTQEMV